jgi:transposase InsO family protein
VNGAGLHFLLLAKSRGLNLAKQSPVRSKPPLTAKKRRKLIEQFIEQYYNRRRLHSPLGYSSPEEYERQAENPNSVAKFSSATMRFFQA